MSDFDRSFQPWQEHFSRGLYATTNYPDGWTKWVIPAYEYLYNENTEPQLFEQMLDHMEKNGFSLVGAVHDYVGPETGKNYMFLPIRKL